MNVKPQSTLNQKQSQKTKISHKFITALAIVSIIGFIGIVSKTLFSADLDLYVEAAWILIIGIGLIAETQFNSLKTLKTGLTKLNFTNLVTVIIGILALLAGIFSIPQIRIENPSFLAVKGILAIIAIIIIVIQTWVIDNQKI